ncbi:hypothetical protein J6590_097450, partial [Homalodisca vitripennis]
MAQLQQTTAQSRSISHIDLYNTGSVHQMHVHHWVLIGYTGHGVLLGMAQLQQTTAQSRSISHIDLYNTGSVHQMHVPYVQ